MTAALLLGLGNPLPAFPCASAVREEKVNQVFILNGQRRRWHALFDAVAGAALVVADAQALTPAEVTEMTVATIFGAPDGVITEITTLVTRVADAIAAGERGTLVAMLEAGKPRTADEVWATTGKMVEIVRRLRPLDEATLHQLAPVIRMIGTHPLMRGLPD